MQSNFKFKHKNCLRRCNILSLMSFQNCSEKNLFFSFFFMVVITNILTSGLEVNERDGRASPSPIVLNLIFENKNIS